MKRILDHLATNRIFSIGENEGGATITEDCDYYFKVHLTFDELEGLGREIIELSKQFKKNRRTK